MRKRWIGVIAVLSMLLTMSGAGIYARTTTSVTNHFDTGIVDIDLNEYQLGENQELEPWEDNPMLLPGSKISKIPEVTNAGNDCWVRIKLEFEDVEGLDAGCLYGMDEDLVYHEDGYFYLHRILKTDETFRIFEGLNIPVDFSQENEGRQLKLRIQADAIQSRNVAADFSSETPWGTVVIEKQMDEGEHTIRVAVDDQVFNLEYQDNAGKLMVNAEDFFSNISTLVPGDVYEDTISLKNTGKEPMNLYFCSVPHTRNTLMDEIGLSIRTEFNGNETTIYDGRMRAEELNEELLLITIPAGEEAKLSFAVTVSPELDNRDAQLAGAVRWIFSTEKFAAPQTGDRAEAGRLLMMCGVSMGIVCVLMIWKRRVDNANSKVAG